LCFPSVRSQALPIAIAVGVIALIGLYFYLNSTYN
jgi:hypothetical protein